MCLILLLLFTSIINATTNFHELPWIQNGYHGLELEVVKDLLPENPIILEAGAHLGEDTIKLNQKWPKATIYAFEPCPHYYAKLKEVTASFANIHIFPFGLFSETGFYKFYMSKNWDGASSLLEDNHLPNGLIYEDQQIEVFCKNLDEWAYENNVPRIDYMWLDMEGAELFALSSAPRILSTTRVISTELNFFEYRKGMTLFLDLYNFLLKNDFKLLMIWGSVLGQATGIFVRN